MRRERIKYYVSFEQSVFAVTAVVSMGEPYSVSMLRCKHKQS